MRIEENMKNLTAIIGITVGISLMLTACATFKNTDLGKEEYESKCAACHGLSGKGDGPQARILPTKPANLTTLAQRNGGVFPAQHVHEVIDGRYGVVAHGPRTMPVWGKEFELDLPELPEVDTATFHRRENRVRDEIQALVDYLRQLQDMK